MIRNGIKTCKPTGLDRLRMARAYYPCPGFIGDPDQRKGKFDRWQGRSSAAYRLYWRARPELHRRMLEQFSRSR